ncbi:Brix domain-containing protein [Mycena sanguinolenta]|uniref:adenosine deaminase n=1 Tax=Mycena sanguinolenta TaxID=230812 RepID=A0A8H6YSA0_9AGAR|nr:Brix domain-containing protein [Mycena sanguinolenta]
MSSPHFADVAHYKQERAALIDRDRSLRRDNSESKVSPSEAKADVIIRELRDAENKSVWAAEHEGVPHPFPGMEFLTGRSIILKTKLFKILAKMPKGGLLHAHLDATVNADFLLKIALEQPALHVRTTESLTALTISKILPEFKALPKELFTNSDVSLTHSSYVPNTWVSLTAARNNFDPALGGPEGFDKWVVGAMTINPSEAYQTHNTVNKIWKKFSSTFQVSTGLIRFTPIWEQYIYEFFRSSVEDGISYVEARINFHPKYIVGEDGQDNVPHSVWLQIFDKTLTRFKADLKQQGREDEFIGARVIYTTMRHISVQELDEYCEDCITLKQEFPHLIAGFDLVGPENVLKPLIYYIEPLLRFRQRQKDLGVDIPLIFHAGETLGDGTEADVNLYDAILLGTLRIGHGFSLVKHPKLMEMCRERNILIEVCPISNEILRLTSSMLMHPLPIMMNNGLPVALCSDDPSAFGNMGVSFDFYQVFVASEVTGLIALRELARDSLKHSTLEPSEKERAISLPPIESPAAPLVPALSDSVQRSRSPSDSEQQKHPKRANTGAASTSNDSPPNFSTGPATLSAATDVTMVEEKAVSPGSAQSEKPKDGTTSPTNDGAGKTSSGSASGETSSAPPTAPSPLIHMRCLIVTQDASIIIGKGGTHVNEIRERSGARVMVSDSIPGNPERILNVSGPLDAVSKAFGLIVRRINDEPFDVPSVPGSRAVTIKFMIPNSRMGSVIGKQGSKIKEIQDASGARLNASEGMLPGSTERVLSVAGVADAIHIATYYIGNILIEAQERMPSSTNSSYRPSSNSRRQPPQQYGGGSYSGSSYVPGYSNPYNSAPPPHHHNPPSAATPNPANLHSERSCRIKIMEPGAVAVGGTGAPGGEGERLVVITGQPANIQMAVQLLYHRLEQEKQKQLRG